MAKTIQMHASQQEKEARLVAGMYDKTGRYSRNCMLIAHDTFGQTIVACSSLMRKLPRRYSKTHSLRCGKILNAERFM